MTSFSFLSVAFDGWSGWIDHLLKFLDSRALERLPLVQWDVSSLHKFYYRCSKCEVLGSTEYFCSKMRWGLIWNVKNFAGLSVCSKWLNKVYHHCLSVSVSKNPSVFEYLKLNLMEGCFSLRSFMNHSSFFLCSFPDKKYLS